ncbi:MAG: bifunctional phosphopantothenoylcysteine decarboxylase/phosphopantothenate--cysteine ligase CoaBC [Lachnospiraceae bacterium]|nr:bifunctional phosphopantothenoylcysteine decarboxylase/phosphopantothenate--cysteine ligase CoaBC [Lachnospiraceae bacterium]
MKDTKNILLIVTGSIAAYKAADLASMMKKAGFNVNVVMTQNACNFITPQTFESLTGNRCVTDMFDRNYEFKIGHISLAKLSDIIVVAPASANIIGKIACGIADDMASTTIMASKCPKLIVPAMNTAMYENPIVQDNLKKLDSYGYEIMEPAEGLLACGDTGKGKLPPVEDIFAKVNSMIGHEHDLSGKRILITAGPTMEAIDPVRYITNHSTGKMGYSLAEAAVDRGADVTLVSGRTSLKKPFGVRIIDVVSASDMAEAVFSEAKDQDIFIFSAAVADFKPEKVSDSKIKKKDGEAPEILLTRTEDILDRIGHDHRDDQYVCGFAMETEDLLANAAGKLEKKNADMICANSLNDEGAGFGTDTNRIVLIKKTGNKELPFLSKRELADIILDEIIAAFPL